LVIRSMIECQKVLEPGLEGGHIERPGDAHAMTRRFAFDPVRRRIRKGLERVAGVLVGAHLKLARGNQYERHAQEVCDLLWPCAARRIKRLNTFVQVWGFHLGLSPLKMTEGGRPQTDLPQYA